MKTEGREDRGPLQEKVSETQKYGSGTAEQTVP